MLNKVILRGAVFRLKQRFANKQVLTLKAKSCLRNIQLSKNNEQCSGKKKPSLFDFFYDL